MRLPDLSCNKKNQAFLTLPESRAYIAKIIYYQQQTVWINVDPSECLPRRIMLNRGFSFAGSPFRLGTGFTLANYSFYNCPYDETSSYLMLEAVHCLSNTVNNVSYTVVVVLSDLPYPTSWITNSSLCHFIDSTLVPVPGTRHRELYWNSYYLDIQWDEPDCGVCEQRGGQCGGLFQDFSNQVVGYDLPGQGLSRKARYGLAIGLGIPGLIGIIELACLFHRRMRMHDHQHLDHQQQQQSRREFSTFSIPHPPVVAIGLDGSSIERYPKTQLGDSGRLPRPNDTVCSICLSEYRPKETLRTIPECNHYFHVDCIDGWHKMNATCPLCRNLPGRSSSPSTSSSSLPFISNFFIVVILTN